MQRVIILGLTGSVGTSALRVLRAHPERFALAGFSYHSNLEAALQLQKEFNSKFVCCTGETSEGDAKEWQQVGCELVPAMTDLLDIEYDSILTAVVGATGVGPTHKAAKQGKKIMLANKESLVMAGDFITGAAKESGAQILPVDSEHNSIFRLLEGVSDLRKIILTASGGPLRSLSANQIREATRAQVLNHPTWNMGNKITVDSAGMINKALEIIEAHHLFDVGFDQLDARIHPQSYVHAVIQHADGTYSFHVSQPDMVYPVAHSLFYPESSDLIIPEQDLIAMPELIFEEVDREKFPGFFLGLEAGRRGGAYPAIFNAANEEAVQLFLQERIAFHRIASLVEAAMEASPHDKSITELDELFAADSWARDYIKQTV